MKVCLVNPPRFKGIPVIREDRCENADRDCVHPPTSLVYIGGVLQELGHDVTLIDANGLNLTYPQLEQLLRKIKPRWVIFRSTPSTFYWDYKTATISKKLKCYTLMLNWNLHFARDIIETKYWDIDVYWNRYHYEYAIPQIIEKYPYYPRDNYPSTWDIPTPIWNQIPTFNIYYTRTRLLTPWAVVRGSKGCPYHCRFCVDAETGWYPRSPELIGEELEYLVKKRKVRYVSFFDNTFEINPDWCLQIADQIEKRNLRFKWYINSRADLICKHGIKFFKRLKEVGLDGSSIGIEFGSQEILDKSGKGTTVKQNYESIKILKKVGVKTYVSCMIGYLGETKEQMIQTYRFIKESKPTGFQINIVIPYESTLLYQDAVKSGVIKKTQNLDWRGLSCVPTDVVPVQLSKLPINEIISLRKQMYKKLYFSTWLLHNLFSIRNFSDLKLGIGYFVSSVGRIIKGVTFSH